ncbi:MAG: RNA pyrophosphohydrolase [Alphaproteobacteria bacterium]
MTVGHPHVLPGYRPCVGLLLVNVHGEVFVGRRVDTAGAWQMPQGGIDPEEEPKVAALRELREEIGTAHAEFLAESAVWRHYDLPPALARKVWGGRYRGQAQKWFALRFTGLDADIDLTASPHIEFDAWQWVPLDRLVDLIVPFKRDVYAEVVAEFRPLLRSAAD